MKWAEFAGWTPIVQSWVNLGNVALVPADVEEKGRGVARYMLTRDRKTFLAACDLLGAKPSDLPRDRTSINIDGPFLLKAIAQVRRATLGPVATATATRLAFPAGFEPWDSKCPTCGYGFAIVASHDVGELVTTTMAGCPGGHRWPV